MNRFLPSAGFLLIVLGLTLGVSALARETHPDLAALFKDWRAFETPEFVAGAPDYSPGAIAKKQTGLVKFQERLKALDTSGWPVEHIVDYHLLRAEMNGMDFNIRVLKPWARDPAFYESVWTSQSDTPAHEGPTHHALVELWTYDFPLDAGAEEKLATELRTIPPLLAQAKQNLTGNARDLWVAGIQNMKNQKAALENLLEQVRNAGRPLKDAIQKAIDATGAFIVWLEEKAPGKTGPSGVGKDNYTWYLQNVHLVPMTWEDEVMLLKRELARAHTNLKLEEEANKGLPELKSISSPEEFDKRANEAVSNIMGFLAGNRILPVKAYMDPAMRAQMGEFVPEGERNFFVRGLHLDPRPLYSHWYHWWDLARMETGPHPSIVRRGPLLYNIFDSRSEGMATAMEEMLMRAGLYQDSPRSREIVWIMLAQRAARGLGSLYAQANEMTMKEAADFHVRWTPRGWMNPSLDLLGFEQQLYLRQPGYGTSYVTGKYLIERLIAAEARDKGEAFSFYDFIEEYDAVGVIPVSLIHLEMTGEAYDILAEK